MKKILFVLSTLLLAAFLLAQTTDIETVMEIQAERELANWIESMLYPIVGDNVAIVDMTLRYPSEQLQVYGSTLDTERSLPGLPVAKSSGVMPSEIAGEETYPTIVLKKIVTIYLSKRTTEDLETFVKQNVASWVNISEEKGDRLEVKRVLDLKAEETVTEDGSPIIQTQDYRSYILMIGAVLLLIILIFIIIFATRMNNLAKSMKEVNIPGLENALRPATVRDSATVKKSSSKDPIAVKLLPQDEVTEKSLNFDFVEELTPAGCGKLLSNEKPEDAAYILSQLSPEFISRFFAEFEEKSDIILRAVIKGKQLSRNEINHLHSRIRKKYEQVVEEENLSFDNHTFITSLINHLPADSSSRIFEKLNTADAGMAKLLRKDIFFLEDLQTMENAKLEDIVREIDRDLLVKFLSISSELVKEKFFSVMTTRNRDIFSEELEDLSSLDGSERENVKDRMLAEIRHILALV